MNIPKIKPLSPMKKFNPKISKPKTGQKYKKMGLGGLSFSQSSLMKRPKIGAKKGSGKRMMAGGLY